ncbi:hypothetical protein [Xanthobacter sp. KR7-225]|uniref:hypothetical protein n=1 Tax=Xanthobacter sp. KR7-225 TaxID=3156613 RepID=UPI0032B4FE86
MNPEAKGLPADVRSRLRQAVHEAGGNAVVAERAGVALSTLNGALGGKNMPGAGAVAAIAKATGRSLDWIFEGDAVESASAPDRVAVEPLHDESGEAGALEAGGRLGGPPPDSELMGRVVDTIMRVAKACGVSIPPVDLGRQAMERYAELMAASSDPAERLAMLKLMAVQIRAELTVPRTTADTTTRKDSA